MTCDNLISVIVPVYNVETYLARCVETIMLQTYQNLEIILIDDGSTDRSGSLCDHYAAQDKRIKVIHKDNGGLSDARNAGLDVCTGDYITFVDSDDYLDTKCFAYLISTLQQTQADVACCEMKIVTDDGRVLNDYNDTCDVFSYQGNTAAKELLLMRGIDTSAPGKLYKKEVFRHRRYPKGKLFEDIPVMYDIVLGGKKISHICYPGYYYYYRTDSISKVQFNPKRMDGYGFLEDAISETLKKYPELFDSAQIARFVNAFNIFISMDRPSDYKNHYQTIKRTMNTSRWGTIISSNSRKKTRLKAVLSLLPAKVVRFIYFKWQSVK